MGFSFIQITDHHLRQDEATLTLGYSTGYAMRRVMRHIADHAAHRADFIVSTGDLVHEGTAEEYRAVRQRLNLQAQTESAWPSVTFEGLDRVPMLFLPGNHDQRDAFMRHLHPALPSAPLFNAVYPYQGVQLVCLDWGPQTKAVAAPEMLRFLSDALAGGQPSIILMHHHAAPVGAAWLDRFIADDVAAFWQMVEGRQVLAIFGGHVHMTTEARVKGIPVHTLRATTFQFDRQATPVFCLQPPHYRIVTVADGRVTSEIVEVPL
ncbi:MAG: metallophosphoesterase [Anaerolineae bacterium]|nr:metallophosphoesterase [Anaerolineae bacterium]